MLKTNDLEYKNFEKESHKLAGCVQLKQYGKFFDKHHEELSNLENELRKDFITLDPMANVIDINFDCWEELSVLQLVQSDNKMFSKVLASLASVCEEAQELIKNARREFYNELLFYGKDSDGNKINLENLSKLLDLLQNVCSSIKFSRELIVLIIKQLAVITQKDNKIPIKTSNKFYLDVCECLGDLLVFHETIESLMNNQVIKNSWSAYKRASRTAQHSQKTFQLPKDKLRSFDKLLYLIETTLLTNNIFHNTIEICLEIRTSLIGKSTNLSDEISVYMTNLLNDLEKNENSLDRYQNWLRLNVLTVFHFHMFGSAEKKFVKHLLELNKKMCAATLVGNLLWYPEEFLKRHGAKFLQVFDERYVQSSVTLRQAYLTNKSQNILKDTLLFCQQTCFWVLQFEKIMKDCELSQMQFSDSQQRCGLIMHGITLAHDITDTLKWITNIHAAEGKPINRTVLMCIFRLNSLVKGILYTFKLHLEPINKCITLLMQCLQYQILAVIRNINKSMTQDKSYKDKNLDVLTALKIAEHCLYGPPTERRLLVVRLALSATVNLTDNITMYTQIRNRVTQLNILMKFNKKLTTFCDMSFLYWHQILLHVYFQRLFDNRVDMTKVFSTFYGINDCLTNCINNSNSLYDEDTQQFIRNINNSLQEKLILPLCQQIEINLRLQTHVHLQVDGVNPFESEQLSQVRNILQMYPIKIYDHFVSIKARTEHYLSTTFYNLATVVPHDWHTYGEMRRLAHFKYKLETVEDYLPNQTLEQGLDSLEIMRNIHVFVSKYLYNLNNQVFIEQCSNNKHLNTINIRHLANSIRMHGIGIMNTTVNFTYQFLRKKFLLFSQFMYDEHIKSRLIKDIRYFRENKTELDQMYPYDRADKFNRSIRKLGVTPTGESFLDLFRSLISHIGNAMGYIRMIRSGGRHFCANAIAYLPDLENNYDLPLGDSSKRTQLSIEQLRKQIEILSEHFDEKTEYFKLLVEVFAPVFRNPENIHLKNFYAIIPPLTINFVEHTLNCRDRLNKKNKTGASFTDDGFAMGVAYILKLLEQGTEMNSLHWFQSVRSKYNRDKQMLLKQRADINKNKDDDKLQQTLALTEKRILKYQQEFDLLYYNLNSARIFFQ